MPYKNSEDKRRWEQEHREQRNAQRRQRQSEVHNSIVPGAPPDPFAPREATSVWKIVAGVAVGMGIVMTAVAKPLRCPARRKEIQEGMPVPERKW